MTYDREDYKARNVAERGFNEDKQWRGLATRYDKLAITYRGGAVLRAITIWLKRLRDTPVSCSLAQAASIRDRR